MSFQVCYTYSAEEIDEIREMYEIETTAEMRDLMKKVGKHSVLLQSIAEQVLDEITEGED